MHTTGFFSVTGTGFTEEEVARQYSIGQAYFESPLENKNKPDLACDFSKGNYFGYRAVSYSIWAHARKKKRLTIIGAYKKDHGN